MINLENLGQNKLVLVGIVAASAFIGSELTTLSNQAFETLQIHAPNKIVSNDKPSKPAEVAKTQVYPVLVEPDNPGTSATVRSGLRQANGDLIDRLFAHDTAKLRQERMQGPSELPGAAGLQSPSSATPGGYASVQGAAVTGVPLTVDGTTDNGAFISGRFIQKGGELEGIALPVPTAPGEVAVLEDVNRDEIKIRLGKRVFVLSRLAP